MMMRKELEQRLKEIGHAADAVEDAKAHELADKLMADFISRIASDPGPLAELAELVLKAGRIDFCRWYE